MSRFLFHPIGRVDFLENSLVVRVDAPFRRALEGLKGFSHVQVLWFFDGVSGDDPSADDRLLCTRPYKTGPERLGAFATRSPYRPNPVALSVVGLLRLEEEAGILVLDYIDADPGSPVLDLKPYTPSLDMVSCPRVPEWCRHWPRCREDSACFDWEGEISL